MTSARYLPAMDIHQNNDEHEIQYYMSKDRYPNDESNDPFELFICPYMSDHHIQSKRWRIHLQKCKENYGGKTKPCVFNASHHVPEPEFDWHTATCPDRDIIRQDLETSNWTLATQVNHNPDWNEPNTGESWDDELDENPEEFILDVKKGMPLALKPQDNGYDDDGYYEEEYYDEGAYEEGAATNGEGGATYEEDEEVAAGATALSVTKEELIPEKPENWNEMSKTQKKNHRRKYDRQQQRMADEGVSEEDFKPETDPLKWSEKQREEKLSYVKVHYPMASDKMDASRFDYTSLLNVVCQRLRINLPEYQPCSAVHGGFAYRCRVHQTWYEGKEFSSTKKDAKHDCAKWAILGMDIKCDNVVKKKAMPIHPKLLRENAAQMREADEVGRCMDAGMHQQRKAAPILRQPNLGGNNSPRKVALAAAVENDEIASSENSSSADLMANYLQRMSMEEKQQPHQPQPQSQPNPMEAYLRRQQAEEMQQQQQRQPQQQQQQQPPSQQRGWGQPQSQSSAWGQQQPAQASAWGQRQPQQAQRPPQQQIAQARHTQQQHQQQQQQQQQQQPARQVRPQQPAAASRPWSGWGSASQQNQQQAPQAARQPQQMNSGADDFPSLGAGSNLNKRGGVPGGSTRGGRGRGTTTMKW